MLTPESGLGHCERLGALKAPFGLRGTQAKRDEGMVENGANGGKELVGGTAIAEGRRSETECSRGYVGPTIAVSFEAQAHIASGHLEEPWCVQCLLRSSSSAPHDMFPPPVQSRPRLEVGSTPTYMADSVRANRLTDLPNDRSQPQSVLHVAMPPKSGDAGSRMRNTAAEINRRMDDVEAELRRTSSRPS